MRLKVLHVINSLTIGGAEILLANSLAPGVLPDHTDNTLVYFLGESHLLQRIDPSVKVVCLEYKGKKELPFLLRRLRKFIQQEKPDIIHTHLNPAGFYTNIARPKKIPQVHTLHIMYSHDKETRRSNKFLERKFLFNDKSAGLIFLSDLLKDDFFATVHPVKKSFVLPNFISDEFFQQAQPATDKTVLKLVAVGTIRTQKNYDYLLRIFEHLADQPVQLDIYGGGDAAPFQKIIQEKKLNIHFKGPVQQVHKKLLEYDLFVMSSTVEGYPLSVVEAMASGLPVFLSDIPALRDIAKENAIFFPLDDPAKAAEKIKAFVADGSLLQQYARRAKDYAEQVGRKELYIQKLLGIYEAILHTNKKTSVHKS